MKNTHFEVWYDSKGKGIFVPWKDEAEEFEKPEQAKAERKSLKGTYPDYNFVIIKVEKTLYID